MPLGEPPVIGAGQNVLVELLALASRSASGTGAAVDFAGEFDAVTFEFAATAVSENGTTDYLDVFVQQQLDGANWDDVAAFRQTTSGLSRCVRFASVPLLREDASGAQHAQQDGAMADDTVTTAPLGSRFRVKWVIGGAGPHTYSFAVAARLHRRPRGRSR